VRTSTAIERNVVHSHRHKTNDSKRRRQIRVMSIQVKTKDLPTWTAGAAYRPTDRQPYGLSITRDLSIDAGRPPELRVVNVKNTRIGRWRKINFPARSSISGRLSGGRCSRMGKRSYSSVRSVRPANGLYLKLQWRTCLQSVRTVLSLTLLPPSNDFVPVGQVLMASESVPPWDKHTSLIHLVNKAIEA